MVASKRRRICRFRCQQGDPGRRLHAWAGSRLSHELRARAGRPPSQATTDDAHARLIDVIHKGDALDRVVKKLGRVPRTPVPQTLARLHFFDGMKREFHRRTTRDR